MKTKYKTILILTLVFAGILFCHGQVLAVNEWADRGAEPFDRDVCWSTSQGVPTDGWIVCRYKTDTVNFPDIDGDLAKFSYAVVPGKGCDDDASFCPTWSFFQMYIQDKVAQDYFVTTEPKGATLTKDPITQCGIYETPSLFTGVKWNPKVGYQNFKKNPTIPYIFSIITKTGVQSGGCITPYVVASSTCYSDSSVGPSLSPPIENPITFNCTGQGDDSNQKISLTVWFDECDFSPDHFVASNITNPSQSLSVPEITVPYFYMVEKDPPIGSDPRIKAVPVSRTGGYSGAIICSEKTDSTQDGENLPAFVWDDRAWFVRED